MNDLTGCAYIGTHMEASMEAQYAGNMETSTTMINLVRIDGQKGNSP